MNIDDHILRVLTNRGGDGRPVTIGDLSREFGVSAVVVRLAARRLVADGRATPNMVDVRGVPTLRGLLGPQAAKQPV
jgi:hypothetical protein